MGAGVTCSWCGEWRGVKPVKVDGRLDTHLCPRCWGIYRETGERPPRYRMRDPMPGPITGRALDLSALRRGRGPA